MNRQALFICYFFFYLMVSCAVSVAQELEYATGTKLYLPATAPSLLDHASLQKTLNTESPCTSENTFWGYNLSGTMLVEYALSNGSIAFTGNTVSNIPGYGVAICSNLDSAISSPTFYVSDFFTNSYYFWTQDTTWVQSATSTLDLYNLGGYEKFLYNLCNKPNDTKISKYDGNGSTLIFSSTKNVGCADIAIDTSGNIYLITKDSATSILSDSLYIISPNGSILKKYLLEFNSNHAYGCFLLNDTFYIGLGNQNAQHPNTILPIVLDENSATIQAPIQVPSGISLNFDLASCTPNKKRLAIAETDSSSLIYPTIFSPNSDGINDNFTAIEKNIVQLTCSIFSRWGVEIKTLTQVNESWDGRTKSGEKVPDGVYFYHAEGIGKDAIKYDLKGFVHLAR
ncbi:MAG: gliding motility-associated C-terminal domain-containing protein [Bacteroidetes bacterium]|nr:gliding motility-associated C-terminal domain-containing protein [Bacteroidota bacterium]